MSVKCKICNSGTRISTHPKEGSVYYVCPVCEFISLDSKFYLNERQELERYGSHNNSVTDLRYVAYFKTFIEETIMNFIGEGKTGLDFGSGPEPVLATLLERDYDFDMDVYDKFFASERVYVGKQYDLITSTEVVEHLDDPLNYFKVFKDSLKADGILAIMTQFHPVEDSVFWNWHYRRDPSHISFYTPRTMAKIASILGFEVLYSDAYKNTVFKHKRNAPS
ncbi:class I SAM-dependent methyltransferase [Fusibacter tunisiensis]|uniref:SAM-dependent methyltransferase n=1 Tax=Fusibacter tunisiensis TaxID=1008308 RepID=A0ABS2MP22_9FIRM|nr:class I SAM-dependent methyltransferase [Fusibacter tunisiensis]MBM7561139.1 SAM-dependent methyltransferase [Fusibacter tunisiensis]